MSYKSTSLNPDSEKNQMIIFGIVCFFIICVQRFELVFSAAIVGFYILFFFLTKAHNKKRFFEIEFDANEIKIAYVHLNKSFVIGYDSIIQIRFEHLRKAGDFNKITYLEDGKEKKISFITVASGEAYIDFLKWIKEKNDKILFDAYPPDEEMEFQIQSNFGFKYRKIHKDTI